METLSPSYPAIDLSARLYYQLMHKLTGLSPSPLDDTPEAQLTGNHPAIAKVAALLPVNANEADLAAQRIAACAQAEDILHLLRRHAGDVGLVTRLNAQYGSMVRTSLSLHPRLMRVQASRQKRETTDGSANHDAVDLHVARRSMLEAVHPDAGPQEATSPEAALEAEAAQTTWAHVSKYGTNSQRAAFETWLSAQFQHWAPGRPDGRWLFEPLREATAEPT